MRKGTRTVFRHCECGCGEFVTPKISKKTGRVKRYERFIVGHGQIVRIRELSERYRADPMSHPSAVPIGSTRLSKAGKDLIYRLVKIGPRKWDYEHRIVAEQSICRALLPGEHVHHINEDTLDNRPENLAVLTHSAHSSLHGKLTKWAKKFDCCTACGTTTKHHYGKGLCTTCFQRLPHMKAKNRLRSQRTLSSG